MMRRRDRVLVSIGVPVQASARATAGRHWRRLGTAVATPVPANPANLPRANALVDSARVAAGEDRHRDAIRWYHRALALYPPLGADLGKELGHQYTWAEVPDTAIQWYQSYLSHHPDDVEAKIGIARALAWSGQLDEAIAAYEALLPRDDEYETEVRLGIAQTISWKDDLGGARSHYDAILVDEPGNLDARPARQDGQLVSVNAKRRDDSIPWTTWATPRPARPRAGVLLDGRSATRAVIADGERTRGLAVLDADMDRARSEPRTRSSTTPTLTRSIAGRTRAGVSPSDVTFLRRVRSQSFESPHRTSRATGCRVLDHRLSKTAFCSAAGSGTPSTGPRWGRKATGWTISTW
jgi:hypothetical protein